MSDSGGTPVPQLSEEDQAKFNKLVIKSKELASQGFVKKALELNERALKIFPSEKLKKRIEKMKAYLAEFGDEEENDDDDEGDQMVHVGNGFYLFKDLYNQLYAHQREGVLWMWGLFKARKGGILGDDMGLGKTIQVIAFLSGMFDSEKAKTVLIVLPVAVITNWEKEFDKWAPGIRLEHFHGGTKRERERALMKVQRKGGVILTSYGMLVNNADQLADQNGREFIWDYVILDEGHKIKNPSNKCSKGLHSIPARNRLLLTGTPVQNNLKEMWALFDWTHQGSLLGTAKTFGMEYEQPICRARQKDATSGEQRLGDHMAKSLQKIINPYFLRRTKNEIKNAEEKNDSDKENENGAENDIKEAPKMPTLTHKNDLICWVFLSDTQQRIYKDFVETDEVKELLNSKRSPLVSLTVLKKICDHPRLLTNRQCLQLGLYDEGLSQQDVIDDATGEEIAASRIQHMADDLLISESGKMAFLVNLLDNLKSEGHRALVFSQSRKILDIIQKVITARGHRVARLDGTMRHLYEREDVINRFKTNREYSVFLLTTQVGGVGLTLTAADRVIIYDPSWNPATDAQAVDRAFRIGQEKDVVIYRLITCGSVEEKIYRRQIFKDSITRQTVGESKNPYRYFSRQDLKELFVLDNPRFSTTQQQLEELHQGQRRSDTWLDAHIAFLHSLDMFGISDHDLMFSREAHLSHTDDPEMGADYIHSRVAKAQQLLGLEAEENRQLAEQGQYRSNEVFRPPREQGPRTTVAPSGLPMHPPMPSASYTQDLNTSQSSEDVSFHSSNDREEEDEVEELNATMEDLAIAEQQSHDSPSRIRAGREPMDGDCVMEDQQNSNSECIEIEDSFEEENQYRSPVKQQVRSPLADITPDRKEQSFGRVRSPLENGIKSRVMASPTIEQLTSPARMQFDDFEAFQENQTPRSLKKGRKSVCMGMTTPSKLLGADPQVYRQALNFTPTQAGPEEEPNESAQEDEEIEDGSFEETRSSASTEDRESSPVRNPAINRLRSADTDDDSPLPSVFSTRKNRRAVIESDDEDEENTRQLKKPDTKPTPKAVSTSPEYDTPIESYGARNQNRRRIIESDEDEDEESTSVSGRPEIEKRSPAPVKNLLSVDSNEEDDQSDVESNEDKSPQQFVVEESEEEEDVSMAERMSERNGSVADVFENSEREDEGEEEEEPGVIQDTPHRLPAAAGEIDQAESSQSDNEVFESGKVHESPRQMSETYGNEASEEEDEEPEEEVDGVEEEEDEEPEEEVDGVEEEEGEEGENEEEEESDEEYDLTEEEQNKYVQLIENSRKLYKAGNFLDALDRVLDALEIYAGDERLQMYALKLQKKISAQTGSPS